MDKPTIMITGIICQVVNNLVIVDENAYKEI